MDQLAMRLGEWRIAWKWRHSCPAAWRLAKWEAFLISIGFVIGLAFIVLPRALAVVCGIVLAKWMGII